MANGLLLLYLELAYSEMWRRVEAGAASSFRFYGQSIGLYLILFITCGFVVLMLKLNVLESSLFLLTKIELEIGICLF